MRPIKKGLLETLILFLRDAEELRDDLERLGHPAEFINGKIEGYNEVIDALLMEL